MAFVIKSAYISLGNRKSKVEIGCMKSAFFHLSALYKAGST